jgi:putative ABC transport system ATP-binding protein
MNGDQPGKRNKMLNDTAKDYVVFENVRKVYNVGEVDIEALADASFNVGKGELAVVVGESGAGKTTLLNILGGMDTLTSGRVSLDGREISGMSLRELTNYRRYDIGFVFQFYNLVQNLTALENVSLATQICKDPLDPADTLRAVGLGDRMNNFPGQLSGGEQQRVAIARALAKNPKLLLCDEPTGALDYNTGKQILQLLQDQARKSGTTVIIITHNKAITPMADRVISVRSGRVVDVRINTEPVPVAEIEW